MYSMKVQYQDHKSGERLEVLCANNEVEYN